MQYMKKIFVMLVLAAAFSASARSQTLRIGNTEIEMGKKDSLRVNPDEASFTADFKPYIHVLPYVSASFPIRTGNGLMPATYWQSYNLDIGFRFLYRAVRRWSVGGTIRASVYSYETDGLAAGGQITGNPVTGDLKAERLIYGPVGLEFNNRIHLTPKINFDLSLYGEYGQLSFYTKTTGTDGSKVISNWSDSSIMNRWQAGVQFSFMWSYLSVYARYRITDMFRKDFAMDEPSRLFVGLAFEF